MSSRSSNASTSVQRAIEGENLVLTERGYGNEVERGTVLARIGGGKVLNLLDKLVE